jgi:hypothetical protein
VPRPPANGGAPGSSALSVIPTHHMTAPEEDGRVDQLPDQVRRRLDEVFGDVLPVTTSDEREPGETGDTDDQLLADRPPHHDREG